MHCHRGGVRLAICGSIAPGSTRLPEQGLQLQNADYSCALRVRPTPLLKSLFAGGHDSLAVSWEGGKNEAGETTSYVAKAYEGGAFEGQGETIASNNADRVGRLKASVTEL